MWSGAEVIVLVILLACMLVIAIVLSGTVEKVYKFGGWYNDYSTKWGFRFSVIGLSIAVMALTLTLYFAWTGKVSNQNIDAKLEQILLKMDK